jgi:hypothetical protein
VPYWPNLPKTNINKYLDKYPALGYALSMIKEDNMTEQEMITKVETMHRSRPGYNFDPAKVAEIIGAGTVPEGTLLTTRADQVVRYEGGKVNVYVAGKLAKSLDDAVAQQGALMQYAHNASKIGSSMGSM